MDATLSVVIPPAPPVPPRDLPLPQLLTGFLRNSISTLPEYAFDVMFSRRTLLGVNNLMVNDPEGARHVLIEARERYRRPLVSVRAARPLAGAGVLLSEGEVWRRQRRTLAPVFKPAAIADLSPHFKAAAEGLLRDVEGRPGINLSAAFHRATLDAVLRALFSQEAGAATDGLAAMVRVYMNGPGRPNFLDGFARAETDFTYPGDRRRAFQRKWFAAVDDIVAQRKAVPTSGRRDLLGLLLQARDPETEQPLSSAEIRDQSATMLFAGFETTSRLLFWAAYLLALDPAEQTRVREEIQAFPPDRVDKLDDTTHWPRLRQVLSEALRLYPPVAYVVRDAVDDDMVLGETVKPGARVWISPWVMHRHRRFWDHPTAFMPSRFTGQRSPWAHGPFIPFGMGPRICIGAAFAMAEAEIMLATLLHRCSISLKSKTPVLPIANVTIRPSYEPAFELLLA